MINVETEGRRRRGRPAAAPGADWQLCRCVDADGRRWGQRANERWAQESHGSPAAKHHPWPPSGLQSLERSIPNTPERLFGSAVPVTHRANAILALAAQGGKRLKDASVSDSSSHCTLHPLRQHGSAFT